MDTLQRHEQFEMEALDALKSCKLLDDLIFGGGTMLRLCYDLNRYSTDLDFWLAGRKDAKAFLEKVKACLGKKFELTDVQIKFYTILLEMRSPRYPRRLKIEIRKKGWESEAQERIAFSKYGTLQVLVKAFTLEEALRRKVAAALDRKDIRDFFDIEFLLRKGAPLAINTAKRKALIKIALSFKGNDYKVTLGSALDPDTRKYYILNGFDYLLKRLQ